MALGSAATHRLSSEAPVVGHGCPALGVGEIDLGQLDVDADGVKAFVAEHRLQFDDIAAVAQEVDGEGMAEFMDIGVVDAGALGGGADHLEKYVAIHVGIVAGGEEGVGGLSRQTGGQVAPEVLFAGVRDEDEAVFVAFALANMKLALLLVVVGEGEVTEFAGADAGLDEGDDNGFVALGGGANAGGEPSVAGAPGAGLSTGSEKGFDLQDSVGFDDGLTGLRTFDLAADRVRDLEFGLGPSPKTGKGGPGIGDGFGGEFLGEAEIVEEGVDVGGCNVAERFINDVGGESSEGACVIVDGVGGEVTFTGEPVAVKGGGKGHLGGRRFFGFRHDPSG